MNAPGIFITIEGIEGAGKSTAIAGVAEWFRAHGREVDCTREPGGTPIAEAIREVLLNPAEEDLVPPTELMLMFAARAQHVAGRIKPGLAAGKVVISDRFTDSSRAYQGAGRGMDRSLIETLAQTAEQGVSPDLTLLLDLPVDVGMKRAAARRGAGAHDRFERERHDFFERVRAGFLELAGQSTRFALIDAAAPIADVHMQIQTELSARFLLGGGDRG
ncbi:dTMP kinase [Halothiobacillus neapolitanus]|jgi:dTMP kinase|uniref:Thymidylate kinase n=1 Tax=Halothiobacillus neapolitanus (strain ATCC 23641 / DSM 15147 / CIP 104769 / NCIMB 8539 / c2) TaxID=555778 RepID=D0L217_HALNC|nr:dTMP kinase [Halothiobacillus neapolitanus]ACX96740.1 thymidylate kinase [Halothiobacillus neapolitanus c2]OZB74257.1 MAG: dTMP kinase [Halothiobacillus sp. 14-55-98]TDN65151.1 thymidylate kinase [Halothiobacillus neapolitanus]